MNGIVPFFKKEICEMIRTKRLMVLGIVFTLLGIMAPALAKLTPKMYEMLSDDLEEQGVIIKDVKVTALDSWLNFEKNLPMALIIMLIIFCSIFTNEYSKGTLIPLITKGLSRTGMVLAKVTVMMLTWTAGLWLCFGITCFYTDFYWDNSTVSGIAFSTFCWWLFGVFMICTETFFSSFASSSTQVLAGTGAVYFILMLAGAYKKLSQLLPVRLTDSTSLYKSSLSKSDYFTAIIITASLSVVLILSALIKTGKRSI